MKACYFYSKFIPEAINALPVFGLEMVYTGIDDLHYWREVKKRWGTDDLMFIEHDIICRPEIPFNFEGCPELWCVYPYNNLKCSLGCTRFRKELPITTADIEGAMLCVWPVPGLMVAANLGCASCLAGDKICWRHLDLKIASALQLKGYRPHVHEPEVRHIK